MIDSPLPRLAKAVGVALGALVLLAFVSAPVRAVPEVELDGVLELPPPKVPHPDLGAMEPAPRERIERAQAGLERMIAEPSTPPALLGEAIGQLGMVFHAFKLLDAAGEAYDEARRRQPREARWAYLRASVAYASGDLEAAVVGYEEALRLGESLATLVRLGDVLLELGRTDAAEARFRRALELAKDDPAATYGLARVAAARDDWARAVELFQRTLELDPDANVVQYPLGQAYRRLGDLDKAREHLALRGETKVRLVDPIGDLVSAIGTTTALEVVRGLARSRREESPGDFLGYTLGQLTGVPGAIEELAAAVDAPPAGAAPDAFEGSRIRYVLGGLLVAAGRDEEAAVRFRQALELDPGLDDARVKLGNALARLGRIEEAEREYDAVLARTPDTVAVLVLRAIARLELRRPADARADLERAVALDPSSSEAQLRLARVLEEIDPALAAERYQTALALTLTSRERSGTLLRLGVLRARAGDVEGALERTREAQAVEPEGAEVLASLGGLLARLGRYDEAADAYAAWGKVAPRDVAPRLAHGTALVLSGRYAEATRLLETAVATFPRHVGLRGFLARHLAACPDPAARDGARAVELAEAVVAERGTPENRETLAAAYAQAGRYPEAVAAQEALLASFPNGLDAATRERFEAELALYRAGRPCCP